MKIHIRNAIAADMPEVWGLIKELAIYEQAPEQVVTTPEQMVSDGFGERPLFRCLVAETEDSKIVGIALYYFGYSTWKGKMLYLDDLVVSESYRRQNIGEKLLSQLMHIAKTENVQQMRWHVLDWNIPAIRFYEKIGAELDGEWITCKMNYTQINANTPD